ncbi:uroporphyrinogen-III C-methyltransferase [Falsirhodobacter halotolerans]|uniref:uroporphyrinogen-III C-methyltransferase n=1 Tax=Falsirhodobacter halotolerans TaxID=1146892 RepID=UPI001FD148E8|nr:uroporphyrinogen-III C-methyltransferase [Falsirhodobacter halotolerans]MCJ8139011.1 uroporphyrinogen-III C-methyltransferase [Falsirhodobacter halotolerans]
MTVSFVSAGPGDPELLTLKAVARLQAADVVLFDDLASGPVLGHARAGADLIAVGKRAGRVSMKQDHISRLLVDHARTGARVVRLKSGDAGLFGRLEEEIAALTAAGIGYEIVPGVPSALAAAAAAGIPLTRRTTARRVQFVTGAGLDGDLPPGLNWPALADPAAVTVLFMGRRTFPAFAARLMAAGMPPETPALLAESVGHPEQSLSRHSISGLAALLADAPAGNLPTLVLYGALAEGE